MTTLTGQTTADQSSGGGELSLSQYDQLRVVGAGGFGRALLVRRKIDALVLVLKEVSLDAIGGAKFREMARLEAEILSGFSHPNIVRIYKFFEESGCLYLELEFCEGGDLDQAIDKQAETGKLYAESHIQYWFAQIADTVGFLHNNKILHRDIKAQNIFLTNDGNTLKLGDFGIAKILDQTAQVVTTRIGTCTHFSPEFCEDNPYDAKADVWALGVILYQLASLKLPFTGANELQIYKKILKGTRDPIPDEFSADLKQLIDRLLAQSPEDRPSMREVVVDPWLVPGMAELAERRSAAADEENKARELYRRKVAPFEANYWSTLTRLNRSPNATSSDTRWLIGPCGVQDFVTFGDVTLVIFAHGEVMALAGVSPFRCRNESDCKDGTMLVLWRSRFTVPQLIRSDKARLHATGDPGKSRIYVTYEDRDGIFYVELNQLAGVKSTPAAVAAASAFGATFEAFAALGSVEPRVFVRGRLPWPREREFWGVCCDSERRLVLCCDHAIKQTVGVWSAEDGRFLAEIGYNSTAPASLTAKFAPYRCAIYFTKDVDAATAASASDISVNSRGKPTLPSLIAVSDHKNSRLHLFRAIFSPSNGGARFVSSEWLKVDSRTSGTVRYPLGVHFDSAGNLWVADSGSSRLQLFSTTGSTLKSICTLPTVTKGWTMAISALVDPFDNFSPFLLVGTHGGVDDLREVICYCQPQSKTPAAAADNQ